MENFLLSSIDLFLFFIAACIKLLCLLKEIKKELYTVMVKIFFSKSKILRMELCSILKDEISSKVTKGVKSYFTLQQRAIRHFTISVYPVVVNINASMCYHSCRYGSFCQCSSLPPDTWPNRLARDGYYYEESDESIRCFACRRLYPHHAQDCPRQHEDVPDFLTFQALPPDVGTRGNPERIVNIRPRAANMCPAIPSNSGAVGIQSAMQPTILSSPEADNNAGNLLPGLPTAGMRRPAVDQINNRLNISDQEVSRQFAEDWLGPPATTMVNCGLQKLSNDSAKCHSCEEIIRGLTQTTSASELLQSHSPNCSFLRTLRQN